MSENSVLKLYKSLESKPFGKVIFSKALCLKAPYFSSISPRFERLEPGLAQVSVKKVRSVTNHIGTVHAIAMANAAELVAGTAMEVSLAKNMRWIPKGMDIKYLKKANTDIQATCKLPEIPTQGNHDIIVKVEVTDSDGELVSQADVSIYVSEKKK